jgi:hypothetical protein
MISPLHSFGLQKEDFFTLGIDLHRPECVWSDKDGIWVSDNRGGIGKLSASGEATLLGSGIAEPNGFCRLPDGSFLIGGLSDGKVHLKFQKANEQLTATANDLVDCAGDLLKLPTSIAFGGEDMRTVYIGSLLLPHLYCFRPPRSKSL